MRWTCVLPPLLPAGGAQVPVTCSCLATLHVPQGRSGELGWRPDVSSALRRAAARAEWALQLRAGPGQDAAEPLTGRVQGSRPKSGVQVWQRKPQSRPPRWDLLRLPRPSFLTAQWLLEREAHRVG